MNELKLGELLDELELLELLLDELELLELDWLLVLLLTVELLLLEDEELDWLLVLLFTVEELLELLEVNNSVELLDEIGGGHSI